MSVPEPCILYPVSFAAPEPVLRVVTGGVERDAVLAGVQAGDLTGWFLSEDDLIEELLVALNDLPGGVTWTAELDDSNMLVLTSSGAARLLWSHANTTLDPTLFGWVDADTVSGTTHAAPNQTRGIWIPGVPGDPRGYLERAPRMPRTVAVWTSTLDGGGRGYNLSPDTLSGPVSWYRIPAARVVASHALATQPYCTFSEAWTRGGIAAGEVFRLYDDRTNRALYERCQCTSAPKGTPWRLEEMNGLLNYEIGPLELVEAS